MIVPKYRIAASSIAGAGQGVFLQEAVARGRVLVAPDAIDRTWSHADIQESPELRELQHASARWFEDRYTLSPDWPDECYLNHSFQPTGLWHLGFVFAMSELPIGSEITVDYRHLLPPGERESFRDAQTGETITGLTWHESLATTTRTLADLLA